MKNRKEIEALQGLLSFKPPVSEERMRRIILNAVLFLIAHTAFIGGANATMIVVVQAKDGIWLGADSVRGLGDKIDLVCKVHETSFGIVIKDGQIEGFDRTGKKYSIDKELLDLVNASKSVSQFKSTLQGGYIDDLWSQLAYLLDQPAASAESIMSQTFNVPMPSATKMMEQRSVVLISAEQGSLKVEQFIIVPDSRARPFGGFRYFLNSPSPTGTVEWFVIDRHALRDRRDAIHRTLHQFGLWIEYKHDDEWISSHPQQAIEEVLDSGSKQFPSNVGPPYAIAHITAGKKDRSIVKWISKGRCPSWTSSITDNDELTKH